MVIRALIRSLAVATVLFVPGWQACARADAAVLDHDFQGGRFDNDALLLHGKNSDQLVRPTARGLLVRIPPRRNDQGPVGIELQPRIQGDFEITVSYQLLEFATPPAGTGIRVKLTTELAGRTKDRVSIERAAIPKEGNVCTSTVTEGPAGKGRHSSFVRRPVLARAGRLRISRTGFLTKLEYTDDVGKFRTLREINLGNSDPSRVTLTLDPGRSIQGAAVLIKELKLSAEALRPPRDEPVETGGWGLKAAVAVNAALILVLGAGVWVLVPRRVAAKNSTTRQSARLPVQEGMTP